MYWHLWKFGEAIQNPKIKRLYRKKDIFQEKYDRK
jgi:hypothetical protein